VLLEGARLEGHAAHRDGRPFASGRILVRSLAPGAEGVGEVPSPVRPDGSFRIDHVAAGPTHVELLAPSSPGALTGLASRELLLADGETTTVDFSLRDVVVAGTVTRAGQPAPGVRVSLRSLEGAAMTRYTGVGAGGVEARGGPPFLVATSREDGGYELVIFSPGRARVGLEPVSGTERYPDREVVVPDVDRFELNFEIAAAQVSGTVVDKDGGEPVSDARVHLGRSSASTGPDGRFALAAEPGERQLGATAPGRKFTILTLNVPPEGLADVRVEMERGLEVRGRVVDGAGRPAPNLEVTATAVSEVYVETVWTLGDGSFRIGGLGDEACTLATGSDLAGWAVRGNVRPGGEPVTLSLRPGGRVAVRAVGADGLPMKDASAYVQRVDGLPVSMPGDSGATDANGLAEIGAPAGLVGIEAAARDQTGRGSVTVRPGETAPLTVVLQLQAPKGP